jgi:OHCU decarboxylase
MSRLERFNSLGREEAEAALRTCCASGAWACRMADARPFRNLAHVEQAAGCIWRGLAREDWLEAFRAHPKIGDRSASGRDADEQSGARSASAETLEALAAANTAYEERFGHIFIVCATGRTAAEMLALLGERLGNDPADELCIAAKEQHKITELRLQKLLAG